MVRLDGDRIDIVMEEVIYSFFHTSGNIILYLLIFNFNICHLPLENHKSKATLQHYQDFKFCNVY